MPHEVHASIVVTLPDKPIDMVKTMSVVAEAWSVMLAAIDPEAQASFVISETRAKAPRSAIVTARAPRKRTPSVAESTDNLLDTAERLA
jgi:hypothetical protein